MKIAIIFEIELNKKGNAPIDVTLRPVRVTKYAVDKQ